MSVASVPRADWVMRNATRVSRRQRRTTSSDVPLRNRLNRY